MSDRNAPKIRLNLAAVPQCRVLLVEDDDSVRMRLKSLLEARGYAVFTATSREKALAFLEESACNILLTDWDIPGMDGIALCRELRARDADQYTYMMVLTNRRSERDRLTAFGTGADDYLSKEASPEELVARMEVGRRITRLEQSLRESSEENRRLSETDPLTGARNHRFLMNTLPRELERSRRYLHPISILSCDLDDFKGINDRGGHEAGDQVLQAFVARVLGCLRSSMDWIARSGGDEFVIILPETGLAGARSVAEKIGRAITTPTIRTTTGEVFLTISVGATALETTRELTETSMIELLRAVDKCLYTSKNLGRDRTTCAPIALAASAWGSPSEAGHKVN